MTDELDELRERIAKARGYFWREIPEHAAILASYAGHGTSPKEAVRVDQPHSASRRSYRCPNWPREITAAWGLVEEMVDGEVELAISHMVGISGYVVDIEADKAHKQSPHLCYAGETAPEAICKAWLAWVEKGRPGRYWPGGKER